MPDVLMFLSNAFDPDPRVYREALSLKNIGYNVKIICWDRDKKFPPKEILSGIKIERIALPSRHGRGTQQLFFLLIIWLKMIWISFGEKFDIAYCHDFDTLPVGVFFKILRKKLIFDSHEVYSKMLGANVSGVIKKTIAYLEKFLMPMVDLLIVTCPQMAGYYRNYKKTNVLILRNTKKSEEFLIDNSVLLPLKRSLGIKDELVISYIANLGPERVISPLIEIVKKDRDLFLIIGGRGSQEGMVRSADESSLNIRYIGYVLPKHVALYTSLADVIYYGFDPACGMADYSSPNKLFEAMAAGKAFMGGNFGEMGSIIKEEKCGIALDDFSKDSIKKALDEMKNKERLEFFKRNSLLASKKKYNWENTERDFIAAVSKLTNNR